MGRVYLAEDTKLHRKVSLKFLSSDVTQNRERLRRFEQEARAISALNHPNTLTIHEISEADGQRFIATEYIEGQTLRERLRSGVDIGEAIEIAIQVVSALVAAHRVNIVHRDIKPENIMIRREDGLVKVLDFGLAKISVEPHETIDHEADTKLRANTAPGVVVGTAAYMSPEQARGEAVDERTDIWSLGVVLYEMVAGCSPFVAGTTNEIISGILSKQAPPPLARYAGDVPERLQEIVEKALTKNQEERYQTSKDLLIDLKRLRQSLELKAGIERSSSADRVAGSASDRGVSTAPPSHVETQSSQPASSVEYLVSQVKSHKRGVLLTAAVLLFIVVGLLFYTSRLKQTAVGSSQTAISSIAVLPFANTGSDANTEFISDGITDNIIQRLSRLPGLKVTAHTAVFHYKDREADPRAIRNELGVEAVLTGRVVKRGEELTIRLELVDARDNSHIWGEQYQRKFSDLLAVQREIPLDVSEQLRLRLSGETKERLTRAYTANTEAYQLYLKGRYSWEKWTLDGAKQAVGYFEEAIKKDPNYALAYAGLADVYLFGANAGAGLSQHEAHQRGREAATKALSLDPELGEAHAALAGALLYDDWDFSGAEREYKRAIELSPSYAEAHHQYSHLLLLLGRINESFAESNKFVELDPVSESPVGHLGYHYLYARQYDEAIRQYQKDLQLYRDATHGIPRIKLGDAYYQKGRFGEAVEEYLKGFAQIGFTPDQIAEGREAFAKSGIKGLLSKTA